MDGENDFPMLCTFDKKKTDIILKLDKLTDHFKTLGHDLKSFVDSDSKDANEYLSLLIKGLQKFIDIDSMLYDFIEDNHLEEKVFSAPDGLDYSTTASSNCYFDVNGSLALESINKEKNTILDVFPSKNHSDKHEECSNNNNMTEDIIQFSNNDKDNDHSSGVYARSFYSAQESTGLPESITGIDDNFCEGENIHKFDEFFTSAQSEKIFENDLIKEVQRPSLVEKMPSSEDPILENFSELKQTFSNIKFNNYFTDNEETSNHPNHFLNWEVVPAHEKQHKKNRVKEIKKKTSKRKHYIIQEDIFEKRLTYYFAYIENPSEFYLTCNYELNKELQIEINNKFKDLVGFKSQFKNKLKAQKAIGAFCFVHVDKFWYRGEVLDWNIANISKKADDILVQLVDIGRKIICSYKNLELMDKYFSKIPKLAFKCSLSGLNPPYSAIATNNVEWPENSIRAFKSLCGIDETPIKKFSIVYAEKEVDSDKYEVDLHDDSLSNDETISECLVNLEFATSVIPKNLTAFPCNEANPNYIDYDDPFDTSFVSLNLIQQNCTKEINIENDLKKPNTNPFLIINDEIEREDMDIDEIVFGYKFKDYERICRFTNEKGTCFKGTNCKLEHIRLPESGITTDKIETKAMTVIRLLPPNCSKIPILITAVKDACRFYVHIKTTFNDNYDENFMELMMSINHEDNLKTYIPFKNILPSPGELVLASDGVHWWRGTFLETVEPHNVARIFLYDIGLTYLINIKDLRQMRNDFLYLPNQAVECFLYKFKIRPNSNKHDAKEFINNNFAMKPLWAYVVNSDMTSLELIIKDEKDRDIGMTLKQFGFVEHA